VLVHLAVEETELGEASEGEHGRGERPHEAATAEERDAAQGQDPQRFIAYIPAFGVALESEVMSITRASAWAGDIPTTRPTSAQECKPRLTRRPGAL
jgi:hypothetical protein